MTLGFKAGRVFKVASAPEIVDALRACHAGSLDLLPQPISHGDLLCVEGDAVRTSPFRNLVFDLYYLPKPWPVRALWVARGWLGKHLGWEKLPPGHVFPNQWRNPEQPFIEGQKVGFMRLLWAREAASELLLQIENRTGRAFFVVKRVGARLYMATAFYPSGPFGRVYWSFIRHAHEFVIRGWLSNCGRSHWLSTLAGDGA